MRRKNPMPEALSEGIMMFRARHDDFVLHIPFIGGWIKIKSGEVTNACDLKRLDPKS